MKNGPFIFQNEKHREHIIVFVPSRLRLNYLVFDALHYFNNSSFTCARMKTVCRLIVHIYVGNDQVALRFSFLYQMENPWVFVFIFGLLLFENINIRSRNKSVVFCCGLKLEIFKIVHGMESMNA